MTSGWRKPLCGKSAPPDTMSSAPHPRGQWTRIGSYFKRADAVRQTTRLMSGNYVWQAPHTRHTDFDSIKVPGQAVPWTEVSAIIAEHPSVKGE